MYNNNNNHHQQEQQRLLIEEPHPGILKYSTSPILNNTSLRKAYEKNKSNVMRDSKKEKKYFAFMPYGIISLIIILSFTCYIYNNNNNNNKHRKLSNDKITIINTNNKNRSISSHPLFTTFDVKTSKNPIESNAAELSHQRLDRYLWVHESKSNDGNNNTNTNKANDSDTMFNNDIIAKEQEGEFKKHHYQLSEDVDEEEVEVDKIYYDEDGNEIEGMIDGESNANNNNTKKSIYAEEPLDILEKTPDHYYYPNFFQDKHDIQSDRRKELAELSFMKHDKILHGMDDLKELLKDVKQRKMKRKKKKKWSSARSSWLKG